jgi:hypothetical protein
MTKPMRNLFRRLTPVGSSSSLGQGAHFARFHWVLHLNPTLTRVRTFGPSCVNDGLQVK